MHARNTTKKFAACYDFPLPLPRSIEIETETDRPIPIDGLNPKYANLLLLRVDTGIVLIGDVIAATRSAFL